VNSGRVRRSLRLLLAVALTFGVVVFQSTAASASPSPGEFESCLLQKINASRAEVGAVPLVMASDKVDQVRAWSEWMRHNDFRHMTASERNPILPDDWTTWAENIAWSSNVSMADCSQIHSMFMNSSGHRANILNANQRYVALGAFTDSSGWWVTELFFASPGYHPQCDGSFCDDDGSVFEHDIERLAAAGITEGCNPPTNDRYCPDAAVTRGMMAAFLVRALGL